MDAKQNREFVQRRPSRNILRLNKHGRILAVTDHASMHCSTLEKVILIASVTYKRLTFFTA